MIHKRSTALEWSEKNILMEGLNRFHKHEKMIIFSNSNSYSGLYTSIAPIFLFMSVNIFDELN